MAMCCCADLGRLLRMWRLAVASLVDAVCQLIGFDVAFDAAVVNRVCREIVEEVLLVVAVGEEGWRPGAVSSAAEI